LFGQIFSKLLSDFCWDGLVLPSFEQGREPSLPHEAGYTLSTVLHVSIPQFLMNTGASVDASFLLKNLLDFLGQHAIFSLPSTHRALAPSVIAALGNL
jgi:hypothetical protein